MAYATSHLAAALREARERKKLSQRELSVKAGVPQGQISKVENGSVDPRLSTFVALARALDLELELVSRNAVPAVQTIMRASEGGDRPAESASRSARGQIGQLVRNLRSVRIPDVAPALIEQALANARMLEHFKIPAPDLQTIEVVNKALAAADAVINSKAFAQYAKQIENIRNELAHAPTPSTPPRPAYSLDGDDDA